MISLRRLHRRLIQEMEGYLDKEGLDPITTEYFASVAAKLRRMWSRSAGCNASPTTITTGSPIRVGSTIGMPPISFTART